jgi:hypothetical protein
MNQSAPRTDAHRPARPAHRLVAVAVVALALAAAVACTHGDPGTPPSGAAPSYVICPPTKTPRILPCAPGCPILQGTAIVSRPCPPCPLTAEGTVSIRPCPPPCGVAPNADAAARICPPPPDPGTGIPGLLATKDFAAWVNRQPPGPPTLIVTGTLVFATAGYSAKIVPANPQGFNPRILLTNLVVEPPKGPVAQVVTEVPVRFVSPNTTDYDRVTILPVGIDLPVSTVY